MVLNSFPSRYMLTFLVASILFKWKYVTSVFPVLSWSFHLPNCFKGIQVFGEDVSRESLTVNKKMDDCKMRECYASFIPNGSFLKNPIHEAQNGRNLWNKFCISTKLLSQIFQLIILVKGKCLVWNYLCFRYLYCLVYATWLPSNDR